MGGLPFDSRMGRRIGLALGLCAVLPVLVFAALAARDAWLILTLTLVLALAGAALAECAISDDAMGRGCAPCWRACGRCGRASLLALDVHSVDETRLLVDHFNRAVGEPR